MENVNVTRFSSATATVKGLIEPESKTWAVTVDAEGKAIFWRRQENEDSGSSSKDVVYVDAELPGYYLDSNITQDSTPLQKQHLCLHDSFVRSVENGEEWPSISPDDDPIDFQVIEFKNEDGSPSGRFIAVFRSRSMGCEGDSEHEAIQRLMKCVIKLAVAGCLDHTGQPMAGGNRRRYSHAFPES